MAETIRKAMKAGTLVNFRVDKDFGIDTNACELLQLKKQEIFRLAVFNKYICPALQTDPLQILCDLHCGED